MFESDSGAGGKKNQPRFFGCFPIILIRARERERSPWTIWKREKSPLYSRAYQDYQEKQPGLSLFAAATLSRSPHKFPESGFSGGLLAGPLLERGEHLRAHGPGPSLRATRARSHASISAPMPASQALRSTSSWRPSGSNSRSG